ncbi:hypothetical protein GCM10020227_14920 [Streptomyces flavovirens]
MPSLTVVVSSDTDICFSPGLYGLLADGANRQGRGFIPRHARISSLMLAHHPCRGMRHIDAIGIVKPVCSGL